MLLLIWAALFALRLAGPSDLMDNDQLRPAMYTLDILRHGNWIVQTDPRGDIASKPPMYPWLAALTAAAANLPDAARTSHLAEWMLYLPCALAVLGTTLLIWVASRRVLGEPAGLFAAGAFLLSGYAAKHVALARTDALFCLTVTAGALLAWRAWESRRLSAWFGYWLAGTAATLTKGPLGVLLSAGGLLAALRSRERAGVSMRPVVLTNIAGGAVLVLIAGAWLLAAYAQGGPAVIDRLIGRELIGHAVSAGDNLPLVGFYKSPFYFLTRFAPWSVPACVGLWRVLARPAAEQRERRFERFLGCWFGVGLVVFSIAPHQRADLLLPIVPAAAILAGRELALLRNRLPRFRPAWAITLVAVVFLAIVAFDRLHLKRRDPEVMRTQAVRDLARRLDSIPGGRPPIIDADGAFALQFFLGIHQHRTGFEEAAWALTDEAPVLVVVKDERSFMVSWSDVRPPRVVLRLTDPVDQERTLLTLFTNVDALALPE